MKIRRWLIGIHDLLSKLEIREVVWENPNPTAQFPDQTINESSAGWKGKNINDYIDFDVDMPGDPNGIVRVKNEVGKSITAEYFDHTYDNSFCYFLYRRVEITSGGIHFVEAQYKQPSGAGKTQNNSALRPMTIYGIRKIGGGYFLKSILTLLLGVGAGHEHYKTAYESCSWKTEKRLDTCFRLRDKCKDVSKSCYEWLLGSVRRNYIWRYSRLPFNSCIGIKHVNINVCVWYMARHTIQSKSFANVNEYEYSTARLFCEHAIIRKISRQGVCLC